MPKMCEDELPNWAQLVELAMARARTPRGRVSAYIRSQLEIVASGHHRLALLLSAVQLEDPSQGRVRALHARLLPLLVEALRRMEDPEPHLTAALVQGLVNEAAECIEAGSPPKRVIRPALAVALDGVAAIPAPHR